VETQSLALPKNLEAETSILGSLLINGQLYNIVEGTGLQSDDFIEERHRIIFTAITAIYNEGKTPDVITVSDRIAIIADEEKTGGINYLYDLASNAPVVSESLVADYCNIIIDKSLYREFIRICSENVTEAYRQSSDFDDIVDKSTSSLINLGNRKQIASVLPIKQIVDQEIVKLKEKIEQENPLSGISCGYPGLDEMCSGFKPGDMIVLAGRPGTGKTSFALNMAAEIAKKEYNVLYFSLEMPSSQLVNRIIATECSVNAKHLMSGKFSDKDEIARLWANIDNVSRLSIFIDDTSKLSVSDLRSRAKKLNSELNKTISPISGKKKKLDCIFVDYLQLMHSNVYREDRVRQVEDISRNIKLFAKDMSIPIVALAQLNRKVEDRSSKVPMLSDLKDSGAIEQDADMVMFIHREDMYKPDSDKKNTAEIYLQKNRHGQQGLVKLRFVPQYTKFSNISFSDEEY
jgi:replicative DNA helicase